MQLKDILEAKGNKVLTVTEEQSMKDAVAVLVENKIGSVLVFDPSNKVVGVLSERDVMRECHEKGSDWGASKVQDVMTKRVIIAHPNDTADHAMGVMTENRIRHIPVMEEGNLVGVISIGDVVKACLKDTQYEIQYLKEYLSGS